MTVRLSVDVPDDVGAFLRTRHDASAVVTEAVRRVMREGRRARQREAARVMAAYRRSRSEADRAAERELAEGSNDVAVRGAEW
ncbi:hypothetical protein ACFY36_38965 [Actinoplanes sp. NPDC000266]